jgi:hypothetical protein
MNPSAESLELDDLRFALEADVVKGRRTLQRLLSGPIVVTPTQDGFDFAGAASGEGWDQGQGEVVMKTGALTGRIERHTVGPRVSGPGRTRIPVDSESRHEYRGEACELLDRWPQDERQGEGWPRDPF